MQLLGNFVLQQKILSAQSSRCLLSLYLPQTGSHPLNLQHECQVRLILTENMQVSELGVQEVGEQGQKSGGILEAVSRVADELDSLVHRVL